MDKAFFKNKKITVFGLGLHGGGVGTVKFLISSGAKVIVTDIKTRDQLKPSLDKLKGLKNIEYVLGQHRQEDFTKVDMVIKTPPIPWTDKNIKLALSKNIPVEVDSSLFFKICKNPIIGITGTKGKTSISTFIFDILKSSGKNPVKVGVGQRSVLDKLSLLKKDSIVIFEISSWRLAALGKARLSPKVAVFKNILPDHMNYYRTMEAYVNDKKNIFLYQKPTDWLVVNNDDDVVCESAKEAKSQVFKFSCNPMKESKSMFVEGDDIYLNDGIDTKRIIPISSIKIPGSHSIANVMAAMSAVYVYGVPMDQIRKAIPSLKGIPHRLEFIKELGGIKYYNDTAATIPEAAISAINTFEKPIILIAGGNSKQLKLDDFGKEIADKTKRVVLLKGTATEDLLIRIKKNLPEERRSEVEVVGSMNEAVGIATSYAQEGDVILLSPGTSSFGLFMNEFDRGNKFKEAVDALK